MEIDPPNDNLPEFDPVDNEIAYPKGGYGEGSITEDDACDADFLPGDESAEPLSDEDDATVYGSSAESGPTPETIRAMCETEARQKVDEMLYRPGSDGEVVFDSDFAGRITVDRIKNAIAAGDIAQVDERLADLAKLLYINGPTRCDGYLSAAHFGSERGLRMLHEMLAAERESLYANQRNGADHSYGHPYSLHTVVQLCPEYDMPAADLIDEYAVNTTHHWQMRMLYASRMAADEPDAPGRQQQVDAVAQELCQSDVFSDQFVFNELNKVLGQVKDPDVRRQLVDEWHMVHPRLGFENFQTLIRTGETMLRDPLLSTGSDISRIENKLGRMVSGIQMFGIPPTTTTQAALPWDVQKLHQSGARPQEVVDELDESVRQLYSKLGDPGRFSDRIEDQNKLLEQRDEIVRQHAEQYAQEGDFTAAHTLLSYLLYDAFKEEGFKQCLLAAARPEHVDAMRPDETMFGFDVGPGTDLWLRYADARMSDKQGALPALARECAAAIIDNADEFDQTGTRTAAGTANASNREVIKLAVEQYRAAHPDDAATLAGDLLAVLRSKGEPYHALSFLSNILIDSGDPVEPACAYEDIMNSTLPTHRLRYKWQLARRISNA